MENKHYVKYLVIVLAFLFLTLGMYPFLSDYSVSLAPEIPGLERDLGTDLVADPVADLVADPGKSTGSAFSTFTNLYVSSAPALSGVLVVGALGLMVLIVVESRRGI